MRAGDSWSKIEEREWRGEVEELDTLFLPENPLAFVGEEERDREVVVLEDSREAPAIPNPAAPSRAPAVGFTTVEEREDLIVMKVEQREGWGRKRMLIWKRKVIL